MDEQALICTNLDDQAKDYELVGNSCWITVGRFSVYIRKLDEGVSAEIYPLNDEMSDSLAECWAHINDLPESEDEDE
jgi:hypothetical protein